MVVWLYSACKHVCSHDHVVDGAAAHCTAQQQEGILLHMASFGKNQNSISTVLFLLNVYQFALL